MASTDPSTSRPSPPASTPTLGPSDRLDGGSSEINGALYIYLIVVFAFCAGVYMLLRVFLAKRRDRLLAQKDQENCGGGPPTYVNHLTDLQLIERSQPIQDHLAFSPSVPSVQVPMMDPPAYQEVERTKTPDSALDGHGPIPTLTTGNVGPNAEGDPDSHPPSSEAVPVPMIVMNGGTASTPHS